MNNLTPSKRHTNQWNTNQSQELIPFWAEKIAGFKVYAWDEDINLTLEVIQGLIISSSIPQKHCYYCPSLARLAKISKQWGLMD